MDVPYLCTITVPLPPPLVPPMPPFDQIFTIIFGSYVLIIGVLTCALVGVASRWCDIAADCRCGAKTITLPPQPLPGPLSGPKGGIAPRPLSAHARRGGPVVGPPQPPLPWGPLSGPRGEGGHLSLQGPLQVPVYIQTARLNLCKRREAILSNWLRLRDNRTKDRGQRSGRPRPRRATSTGQF